MNRDQAKKILSVYRPGIDEVDPEVRDALRVAETDSELKSWLEQHQQFQRRVRAQFRNIEPPGHLRERILAQPKVVRPQFPIRAVALSAAAVVIICLSIALLYHGGSGNRFGDYQNRIVRSVIREYHMDLVTNDLAQIRLAMASRGAPSDFALPKGLSKLPVVGGGALKWKNNPVTMVCFDRGDKQMLFFFVVSRTAMQDAPDKKPQLDHINRLQSASWVRGDKVYVLAGPEENNFVEKYL